MERFCVWTSRITPNVYYADASYSIPSNMQTSLSYHELEMKLHHILTLGVI